MNKNLFIVFEGLDGSGKDIQQELFISYLKSKDKYINIWVTHEPTKITEHGKKIKEYLKSEHFDKKEALKLYIQDRIEHSDYIREYLKTSFILSSRYDISTYVYQGTQGYDLEEIYNKHNYSKNRIVIPDLTFIYEVSVEEILRRIKKRNNQNLEFFEKKNFLKKAKKLQKQTIEYLGKKMPDRKIVIINGEGTIKEVQTRTIKAFEKYLKSLNS